MVSRSQFYGTNVHNAAKMLFFGDKNILENSKGEVTHICNDPSNEEDLKNSEIDPDIFGTVTRENVERTKDMGHIALETPVVNINYLNNIHEMLGLKHQSVKDIIYCSACLVTHSTNNKYPKGVILTDKQYAEASVDFVDKDNLYHSNGGITVQFGAKAIEMLLKEKGFATDNIILHYVPVMPFSFRFNPSDDPKETDIYHPHNMETLYNRILRRNEHLRRLEELNAPEIIIRKELEMIQKVVDAYIDNGAGEYVFLNEFGEPLNCLRTVARYIGGHQDREWNYRLFKDVDVKELIRLAKEHYILDKKTNEELDIDIDDPDKVPDNLDEKINDEAEDEWEILSDQAEKVIEEPLKRIIENRYPELADSHEKLYEAGKASLERAINAYAFYVYEEKQTPNKDPKKDLLCGIIPHMDTIAEHQA